MIKKQNVLLTKIFTKNKKKTKVNFYYQTCHEFSLPVFFQFFFTRPTHLRTQINQIIRQKNTQMNDTILL